MKSFKPIDVERARSLLEYRDGKLYWKARTSSRVKVGMEVCNVNAYGYIRVGFDGVVYMAHRVIWAIVTGADPGQADVDHINHDKLDNRIENLRIASRAENIRNQSGARANNKLGVRNVVRHGPSFRATVKCNGVSHRLGVYPTIEEAAAAAEAKRIELFGQFKGNA
jgi:hypothetical protein